MPAFANEPSPHTLNKYWIRNPLNCQIVLFKVLEIGDSFNARCFLQNARIRTIT